MPAQNTPLQSPRQLDQIAGWPVGIVNDRLFVFGVGEVSYFFLASAITLRLIDAEGISSVRYDEKTVYMRTYDGRTYRTGYATLASLYPHLDERVFVWVNRSLIVNRRSIRIADFGRQRIQRIGVKVGKDYEYLTVSRRALSHLRELIGAPVRIPEERPERPLKRHSTPIVRTILEEFG